MRIKKISETTPTMASIINGYSTSTQDGYSCDYINGTNTYSTDEVDTGKRWIDDSEIYRIVLDLNGSILVRVATWNDIISVSSLNIDKITLVTTIDDNGYTWSGTISKINNGTLQLYGTGASGSDWKVKDIVLEYTKTTDNTNTRNLQESKKSVSEDYKGEEENFEDIEPSNER